MGYLILIAGVSRSGKSSLATSLCQRLDNAVHLDQDDFVKPESKIPTVRDRVDWEHPKSVDWNKWYRFLDKSLSEYNYVIAEGIFVCHSKEHCSKAHLIIELLIDEATFKARRNHENRWGDEPSWYLAHVWESHKQNHNPHQVDPQLSLTDPSEDDLNNIIHLLISK